MLSIFDHELAQTAVVSIGRGPARSGFYHRTLHFRRVDESATLVPLRPRAAQPLPTPALVRRFRATGSIAPHDRAAS